jgi:myb proto-oncogene protein
LIHTPFTDEEDAVILSLHKIHGNKWALIARHLPGRTENTVKLRCHTLLRKNPNIGNNNINNSQQSSDHVNSSSFLDQDDDGDEDDDDTGDNHSDDNQDQEGEDEESEHGGTRNFKGAGNRIPGTNQTASSAVSEEVKNLQELLSQDMEERERLMKLQEIIGKVDS